MAQLLTHFVPHITFHHIPTIVLMNEVRPMGMVPDTLLMQALAYQADPAAVFVNDSVQQQKRAIMKISADSTLERQHNSVSTATSAHSTSTTTEPINDDSESNATTAAASVSRKSSTISDSNNNSTLSSKMSTFATRPAVCPRRVAPVLPSTNMSSRIRDVIRDLNIE